MGFGLGPVVLTRAARLLRRAWIETLRFCGLAQQHNEWRARLLRRAWIETPKGPSLSSCFRVRSPAVTPGVD